MCARPTIVGRAFFCIFGFQLHEMKKYFFSFFFSFLLSVVVAQIPVGYYNSAQGLTGAPLKLALHNIIKNHNSVSYASLWTHFQNTDKKANGKVWDIYSDNPTGTPPYTFTFVTDQCGSYNSEADCYNREHSWPQSWFNSETVPSSDLFHVYPTDGYVNNIRSNYPYGDVGVANTTTLNGSVLGWSSDAGYSSAAFEPIDEYKGDVARSYFYMSTRYMNEDAGWATSAATNKSTILPWQVNVLLQWSHQDTVSAKEIARNNAIYQIQNNRNPYIDNPEWIDSIWTATLTSLTEQELQELTLDVYPNPATDKFTVAYNGLEQLKVNYSIVNMLGQIIASTNNIRLNTSDSPQLLIDCSTWENGIYYLLINSEDKQKTIKLVVGDF
jgi:endonuclease I